MLQYEWDKTFNNIGIVLEPRIVRVLNDDVCLDRIKAEGKKCAYAIAEQAVAAYRARYDTPLKISVRSLACEIYWHCRMKEIARSIEKRRGEKKLTRWIMLHMDVIDCGEQRTDSNRFLWDLLSIIF